MIPVSNPHANYRAHEVEIRRVITGVLERGCYIGGGQVKQFEKEFAKYVGAKHAIGVNSGTDALIIAMKTLGIGRGDHVATIANTALATVAAILATGARPIVLDADRYESAMALGAKAIVPVHLYGEDVGPLLTNLPIIEDCAQACCRRHIRGLFGCFSFYPTKNLGAIGDGGMIVTSDDKLAKACRQIREYGWNSVRTPQCLGINSRLDSIQAAILRVKLKYLDQDNERRRAIALRYWNGFVKTPIACPDITEHHCFHLYVIECDRRDELMQHLHERGIQAAIHYPVPIHKQPIYKDRVWAVKPINAERRARRILSLPMYPELTDEQVDQVIDGVHGFYK